MWCFLNLGLKPYNQVIIINLGCYGRWWAARGKVAFWQRGIRVGPDGEAVDEESLTATRLTSSPPPAPASGSVATLDLCIYL